MSAQYIEKMLDSLSTPVFVVSVTSHTLLYANTQCEWTILPSIRQFLEALSETPPRTVPGTVNSRIDWNGEEAWLVLVADTSGSAQENLLAKAMETVTATRAVEILKCRNDAWFTLLSFSDVLPAMLGYERQEIQERFQNHLAPLVHPDDRAVLHAQTANIAEGEIHKFEYRLRHKNGNFLHILDHSRVILENGEMVSYCILLDVTLLKEMEATLRTNEDRYRLALAGVCDIIYDYDIQKQRVTHCSVLKHEVMGEVSPDAFPEGLFQTGVLDRQCREELFACYAAVTAGRPEAVCLLSGYRPDGGRFWCRHRLTLVSYTDGRPAVALGTIQDITEQKRQEQSLLRQSETDALTGLLNRGAFEARVSSILAARSGERHVFGIIDVDDFKGLNDTCGHLVGDQVLSGLAAGVRLLLGAHDLLGRLGGDEFAFFLVNTESADRAKAFGASVCRAARLYQDPHLKNAVSCTVGMAVSPESGRTFRELYSRADVALYRAKKQGKNTFSLYESPSCGETVPMSATSGQQHIDGVTGYRNFESYRQEAENLLAVRRDKYAIWFIDIKNFKYINEVYGYDTGDEILKSWADFISTETREGETFTRISGDNFTFLSRYNRQWELEERFLRFVDKMEGFTSSTGRKIRIELVAGMYLIERAEDESSLEEMLNRANIAQKIVKPLHGSNFIFYSADMREKVLYEMEIESSMSQALESREYVVFLHPQISIGKNGMFRAEALVRWRKPTEKGIQLIPPVDFIPLFERNGFIIQLDFYVFEKVCCYLASLPDIRGKVCIAVNVSRLTMLQPDFVERYTQTRDNYHLPHGCLELEFTESIAVENYEEFKKVICQLKSKGFLCSLDDFGTGHSSLNVLKNLPVDTLKLDRLFFVEDGEPEKAWAVIRNTMHLARDLQMFTVAEGIERLEQVGALRGLGCDCVQGFVFTRPIPMENFSWDFFRKIGCGIPESHS